MNCLQYVDVFQGNSTIDLPEPQGISATWIFVKAQTGNTHPFAAYPFGKMTCGGFSGGYPTGGGNHMANSCGLPAPAWESKQIRGFSHIHHSGTGGVGHYFNYAVTVGFQGSLADAFLPKALENEYAIPGLYAATYNGIRHQSTVTAKAALHSLTFPAGSAHIAVDFANDGLTVGHGKFFPKDLKVRAISDKLVAYEGVFQDLKLYMVMECAESTGVSLWKNGELCDSVNVSAPDCPMGAVFDLPQSSAPRATLRFGISPRSLERALADIHSTGDFETVTKETADAWNQALDVIHIDADEDTKTVFYSNFYHSILKPSDWTGESFLYDDPDGNLPFTLDYSTFWDQYKTQLPLIFWLYPEMSAKICDSLTRTAEFAGKFPNALDLTGTLENHAFQARLLGALTLATGYFFGVYPDDPNRLLNLILENIRRQDDFMETGICERYTHILDVAQACEAAAVLAEKLGRTEDAAYLWKLAERQWGAYAEDGLLSTASNYYEGGRWNYSFRLTANMDKRIAISGGREQFVRQLEHFFGFNEAPLARPTIPEDYPATVELMNVGRFEGYNNEPDMETPYAFLFAGRHDRTCEVVHRGMTDMFCKGLGGIPGNNDTGGLSSCYLWNMLGLFPAAGLDFIMLGTPGVSAAEIKLSSGKMLSITVENRTSPEQIYVKQVLFNGIPVDGFRIPLSDFMNGGSIVFQMKSL